jgi:6-hydroxytryprostatin B O-methyltransferase
MAMTNNYFHEPREGYVAHTAGSKLLLNPQLNDTVGYIMEESFPSAAQLANGLEMFGGSEERNASPWNLAHGTEMPLFEYLETDPVRMTTFLGHMESLGGMEGYNIKHLLNGYDWKGLGKGTVVDVGGSTGHASFAIAEVAPELNFVVQDLENVVAGVKERVQDRKHLERVTFQAHSFFELQPVTEADVYLLRFICHDYSDKYSAEILRNVIEAMGPKSRIVVMDGITPPPGAVSKPEERKSR